MASHLRTIRHFHHFAQWGETGDQPPNCGARSRQTIIEGDGVCQSMRLCPASIFRPELSLTKDNATIFIMKTIKKTKKNKDAPLAREDWTEAAWQMLGRGSLDQVRVETLARHLKVTRGSFYWHFRDRDDLIEAILERWFSALGLEQSILPVLRDISEPAQRLWVIADRIIRQVDNSQFVALRLWALGNDTARQRLEMEDRKRLEHFVMQFRELGFSETEALVRGDIYQALVQGEFLRSGGLPLAERIAKAKARHNLLVNR